MRARQPTTTSGTPRVTATERSERDGPPRRIGGRAGPTTPRRGPEPNERRSRRGGGRSSATHDPRGRSDQVGRGRAVCRRAHINTTPATGATCDHTLRARNPFFLSCPTPADGTLHPVYRVGHIYFYYKIRRACNRLPPRPAPAVRPPPPPRDFRKYYAQNRRLRNITNYKNTYKIIYRPRFNNIGII